MGIQAINARVMTSEKNVLTKIFNDMTSPPFTELVATKCSLPEQAALVNVLPAADRKLDQCYLWSDSENTPEASVKHEGLLSAVEIVAWYATSTTGAIHRNHFVV